jgi:iron complex outermembrane receptor protein
MMSVRLFVSMLVLTAAVPVALAQNVTAPTSQTSAPDVTELEPLEVVTDTQTGKPIRRARPVEVRVVTAQKRAEKPSEVPISLDALTGRRIEQMNQVSRGEVLNSVPNVQMNNAVAGTAYAPFVAMRGVGSAILETDPSVGMYVDGISLGVTQAFTGELLDVNRVEVLRGPQGTLYGRNNVAGSINFLSNLPDPRKLSGEIGVDYSRFESVRGYGFVNVPLANGWAVRGAFSGSTNDGYTFNTADGSTLNSLDDLHGRLTVAGKINDRLAYVGSVETQSLDPRDAVFMRDENFRRGDDSVDLPHPFKGELDTTTARSELTYRLDNGDQIVSVTGYTGNDTTYSGGGWPRGYFDATAAFVNMFYGNTNFDNRVDNPFEGTYRQYSQELRYVSNANADLKWVGGLYAEYSERERLYGLTSTYDPNGFLPGDHMTLTTEGQVDTTSIAAFVDGTYALADRWKAFGGIRVGYDWKDFDYRFNSDNPVAAAMLGATNFAASAEGETSAPYATPKIGLQYDLADGVNVYGSISRGYKSGGFNSSFLAIGDDGEFDSESITSYELGWKANLLNDRLSFNGSIFYIDWRDQQVQTTDVATGATPIANAPKSRSYGGEIDMRYQIDNHWRFGFGMGYTDAIYVDFEDALATGSPAQIDASGNRQQYISKYTGNVNLAYTWNVGFDNLVGMATLFYQYRSGFYFDVENTLWQSGYGLLGARIGVENDKYAAYVWGNNLTDERYRMSFNDYTAGRLVTVGEPLTIGGTIKFKF